MKIAVAQINTTVGDFAGNARAHPPRRRRRARRGRAARRHARAGALRLSRPRTCCCATTSATSAPPSCMKLATYCLDVAVVVGHPAPRGPHALQRRLACCATGASSRSTSSSSLPNYQVFDEKRYFETGNRAVRVRGRGPQGRPHDLRGPLVPRARRAGQGRGRRSCCSRSTPRPSTAASRPSATSVMGARVKETGLPLLYVHWTGGQDELVFDGASFALDGEGALTYQAETFRRRSTSSTSTTATRRAGRWRRRSPRRR